MILTSPNTPSFSNSLEQSLRVLSSAIVHFKKSINGPYDFSSQAFGNVTKALAVVEKVLGKAYNGDGVVPFPLVMKELQQYSSDLESILNPGVPLNGATSLYCSEKPVLALLHSVHEQCKRVFAKIHDLQEARGLLQVESSPFYALYTMLQRPSWDQNAFLPLFRALVQSDQEMFATPLPTQKEQWVSAFEAFLLQKVEQLSPPEKKDLYARLRAIAINEDKLPIKSWDKDWGQFHLKTDHLTSRWVSRLARALGAIDQEKRQTHVSNFFNLCKKHYGEEIALTLFKYSPIVRQPCFTEAMKGDLLKKGEFLHQLRKCKEALIQKHPTFPLNDPAHPLYRKWKEKELNVLLISNLGNDLLEVLNCLIKGESDALSDEFLLEVILNRFSFHPREEQIKGQYDLRNIRKMGMQQATRKGFEPSVESRCKSIFTVHSEDSTRIGKYKPNPMGAAAREVKCAAYDSLLGTEMTPPTGFAYFSMRRSLSSLKEAFQLVEDKGKILRNLEKSKEWNLAKLCQNEMMQLHKEAMNQAADFPPEIQQKLYGCLSVRYSHEDFNAGNGFWHESDLKIVPDKYRIMAIDDLLKSEAFFNFEAAHLFEKKDKLGSIQRWINEPHQRVIEFIVQDPTAGKKMGEIPKSHVHLYCILGLIKGSRDGFSGNALVTFAEDKKVKRIHEFDDERSMPNTNEWHQFRLWQFGLPQANLAFDRTTLMLLCKTNLLKQMQVYNRSDVNGSILPISYQAQEKRIAKMMELFESELKKPSPTLTPRDLFFEVFGGRENFEYWNRIHEHKHSPWHVFEYDTGEVGRGAYFTSSGEKGTLLANLDHLSKVESEHQSKAELEAIRKSYPKAQLVVKFDAGFGNAIFIKGSLPGMGGNIPVLLKSISNNCWIWEADREIQGEYKIYFNWNTEEKMSNKRILEANYASRVVVPRFW